MSSNKVNKSIAKLISEARYKYPKMIAEELAGVQSINPETFFNLKKAVAEREAKFKKNFWCRIGRHRWQRVRIVLRGGGLEYQQCGELRLDHPEQTLMGNRR